jgi:L-threonylcarbamoyladenylate synthase
MPQPLPFSHRFACRHACDALRSGGLIAYPTEGVFGLGCDPFNPAGIEKIFQIKQRRGQKQFILIAASLDDLRPLLGEIERYPAYAQMCASWPGPHTWICPAADNLPPWLSAEDRTLAVRVTAHPTAAALCRAWGAPLVSTSANRSGRPPIRSAVRLMHTLGSSIDYRLPGTLGQLGRPTSIRILQSGKLIRGD